MRQDTGQDGALPASQDRAVVNGAGQAVSALRASVPSASAFDAWIDELDETVIQGEYGYEPGEFAVYPEHWRAMWRQGLTPTEAFRRALDAHAEARVEADRAQAENWQRIQAADAQAIEARRAETGTGSVADESAVVEDHAPGA